MNIKDPTRVSNVDYLAKSIFFEARKNQMAIDDIAQVSAYLLNICIGSLIVREGLSQQEAYNIVMNDVFETLYLLDEHKIKALQQIRYLMSIPVANFGAIN